MTTLAICSIMRNEGEYLREWLDFHRAVGVSRFVLYNNNSDDDTAAIVAAWPHRDTVTLIDWPEVPGQLAAYRDMIANHRDAADWCAFIDCDEFIVPQGDLPLLEFLERIGRVCSGVYAHWLMFGSAGQIEKLPGRLTERFVRRGHHSFPPNHVGKSIVRLADAVQPRNPHVIETTGRLVNDANEDIDQSGSGIHRASSHRYIAINHYFTKSLAEWRQRRARGKADKRTTDADFARSEAEFHQHDANDIVDTKARDILRAAAPETAPPPLAQLPEPPTPPPAPPVAPRRDEFSLSTRLTFRHG